VPPLVFGYFSPGAIIFPTNAGAHFFSEGGGGRALPFVSHLGFGWVGRDSCSRFSWGGLTCLSLVEPLNTTAELVFAISGSSTPKTPYKPKYHRPGPHAFFLGFLSWLGGPNVSLFRAATPPPKYLLHSFGIPEFAGGVE